MFARNQLNVWQLALSISMLAVASCYVWCQEPDRPLYVMNRDGTGLQLVTEVPDKYACGSPCWSPDGSAIVFDAHGERFSNQHIYTIDLEQGILTDFGPGGFPSWSPDGKQLAFHEGRNVVVVNADGSNAHILIENATHPRWSPDGKRIAYLVDYGENLGVYDVENQDSIELFDDPQRLVWGQSWSPDGKWIAMMRRDQAGGFELVVFKSSGDRRDLRVRHRAEKLSSHTSWAPDNKILFGVYAPNGGPRHLHFVDALGKKPPQPVPGQDVTLDYCDGVWSADGKKIAFSQKPNVRK